MKVHDVIRDFARLADLPGFTLDALDVARLRLDDTINIDFEYDADNHVLHLYSEIARASDNCLSEYELLLEANLFLNRSVGTAIAFNPQTRQFLSCVRLDPEFLAAETMIAWVEKMAIAVETMRIELNHLANRTPDRLVHFSTNQRN